jgi:hypothetical protein
MINNSKIIIGCMAWGDWGKQLSLKERKTDIMTRLFKNLRG